MKTPRPRPPRWQLLLLPGVLAGILMSGCVLAQSEGTPAPSIPVQPGPTQTQPAPPPPPPTVPVQSDPVQAAPVSPAVTPPAPPLPDSPARVTAPEVPGDLPGVTAHEQAGRCVEGSEQACMGLSRQGSDGKERRILVIRTGTTDDTGIYTICGARDDDPEDTPNIGVFSETGPGGIRILLDKNVITVPLALVTQKPAAEGQEGSDGRVEASAGSAQLLDAAPEGATDRLSQCGVQVQQKPVPDTVLVTQGKTRLKGQKLVYDETDGIARIDGPITFTRENDKEPLSGSSDRIEVNVDEETTLLVGNVKLTSKGGRVSTAGRVEYDDNASTARLYGTADNPAQSTKGQDVMRVSNGSILYDLETNDVIAVTNDGGNISGEVQDNPEEKK